MQVRVPVSFELPLINSGLHPLTIKGKRILPIVQGGMGVGVSAHRLAGAVAACGGMGTISSIDASRWVTLIDRADLLNCMLFFLVV